MSTEPRVLEGEIRIPYKWTTGPVIGAALTRLRDEGRMTAARCPSCEKSWCPPLDSCPACHHEFVPGDLVPVGPEGTVTSWTRVETRVWGAPAETPYGLVSLRLDGADTDFIQLVTDRAQLDGLKTGARMRFSPSASCGGEPGKPLSKVRGEVAVPYRWSYGRTLERFFEGTRAGRIQGAPCTACGKVLVPPAPLCGACYAPTSGEWVDVGPGATVTGFTTVFLEFPGQPKEPPYTYAHVRLDGSHTDFFGVIDDAAGQGPPGDSVPDRPAIHVGMRVELVWNEHRTGGFHDILCFRPA